MRATLIRMGSFILLLLGGYSAYWYYIAYFADQWVNQLVAGLSDSGFELGYRGLETAGFPYRLEVHLLGTELIWRDGPMEVRFQSDDLMVITPPWNRRHLIFQAQNPLIGVHSLEADWVDWTFRPEAFSASFSPRNEGGYRFSAVGNDVETGVAGQRHESPGRAKSISLHIRMAETPESSNTDAGLLEPELARLAFAIEDWTAHDSDASIDLMEIEATLHSRFWPHFQRTALENWTRQGSSLEVTRIAAHLPGATAIGEGSLALDDQLRPLGALSFALSDAGRTGAALQRIWSAAWLDKLVQALDATPRESTDDSTAILSLMLIDGELHANGISINSFDSFVRR